MLAFDIETYAAWDSIPESVRSYLQQRDANRGLAEDDRRAARQSAGLLPGVAQVIAIGLAWGGDSEARGEVLSLDPRESSESCEIVRFASEADLLRAFWERAETAVASGRRLVSYYGRGFDGPMLALRSATLGVRPSVHLVGELRSVRPHLDLADLLNFYGARRERYSLDYWCAVFGVDSPKTGLSGPDVGAAYEAGKHDEIARYALTDARATAQLYEALRETLLPLYEAH